MCETVAALVVYETELQIYGVCESLTNPPSGHVPPGSAQDWGLRRFFSGGGRCSLL